MPRLSSGMVAMVAALCLLSGVSAQEPAPGEIPKTGDIVVRTLVKVAGRIDPGKATEAAEAEPRVVDRVVEWQVLGRTFATPASLGKELERIAMDPQAMRPDAQTGGKMLAAVRVAPDPATHWEEIVGLWDLMMASGYQDLQLEGVDTREMTAVSVAAGRPDAQRLVLPSAMFNEVDDFSSRYRLAFDVLRDGTIARDGKSLFVWKAGEAADLGPLRKSLREVRETMRVKKQLVPRRGHDQEAINVPVLLRADRWAEWRDVLRLCSELLDPEVGYWSLHLAVVEPPPGKSWLEQGR
ncbi:MAG: hypothetical protein R3F29_01910 [Planctomycetota bacterium]